MKIFVDKNMEHYRENRVGNITSNSHGFRIEGQRFCQYGTNKLVTVKHQVSSNQNFDYSFSQFVDDYAHTQLNKFSNANFDARNSQSASKNVQGSSCGFEKEAVFRERSKTFQSCMYSNTEEVKLEAYVPSLQFSQIVPDYSVFEEQCLVETGDCTEKAFLKEKNNQLSACEHDSKVISKLRRTRTVFEPYQIRRLQHEFDRDMYMVGIKRKLLSRELNLTEKQVKVWFQNKRMKMKRDCNRRLRHI